MHLTFPDMELKKKNHARQKSATDQFGLLEPERDVNLIPVFIKKVNPNIMIIIVYCGEALIDWHGQKCP